MKQKKHLLTEKLVNAHLKPTSRVRQNTSYIIQVMTSRHLCPGSDHTHSCNGRQAPRRIPQPEKNWARVSAHLLLREGIQKKTIFLGKSPKLWVGGGQES